MSGTGSYGPLLGGWPGLLAELPRPIGPPPAASLEAVVALVAARVAPLGPDLQRALERDLQLLAPGGEDGGLEWLAGAAEPLSAPGSGPCRAAGPGGRGAAGAAPGGGDAAGLAGAG